MARDRIAGDGRCEALRPLFAAYAGGTLDAEREREVWEHLAGCPPCRNFQAQTADPAVLFVELAGRPLPASFWDGFMERLRARLPDERRYDWRALVRFPRLAYLTAPLAMLLVVGAALLVTRPAWRSGRGVLGPGEALISPYEAPPRGRRAERLAPGPVDGLKALPPRPPANGSPQPPALEEVESPGARVYRFSVAGGGEDNPIYLVVDESIDF